MKTEQPTAGAMRAAQLIAEFADGTRAIGETTPQEIAHIAEIIDRETGARELREALQHMRWCRNCAEGDWQDCEEGRAALAALAKAGTP